MTKSFVMEIVTPARKVLSTEVESVVVPSADGYLGILVNHAPLVTALGIGVLRYTSKGKEDSVVISGGFMEVNNNKLSIMADTAELSGEIDIKRAETAEKRARERLQQKDGVDVLRAELALRRALARQEVGRG